MEERIEKNPWMKRVVDTVLLAIGVIFNAIGAGVFILPYHFLCGGATGFGRCISHFTGMPVSYAVGIVSGVLFLLGLIFLGLKFAGTIVLGTVLYPLTLNVIEHFPQVENITREPMLAAAFGAIFIGIGVGIVVRAGGSTGGSDVIAILLHRKLGWNTALILNIVDIAAILAQCTFASIEDVLFGVLIILGYSVIVNKVLLLGSSDAQFIIVSRNWEAVRNALLHQANVGSTVLHGQRGYTGEEQEIIICTVSRRRVRKVKEVVQQKDSMAFITMLPASEVRGRGFTFARNYGLEKAE